jgi:YVTN family beta-propeller protein
MPDGKTVLVTSVTDDVLHFVDAATNEVEQTIGIGRSPQSVIVASDGAWAFSVTRDVAVGGTTSTVSIIDLGKFDPRRKVRDLPVEPLAARLVVYDGLLYVTCAGAAPGNSINVYELATMRLVRQLNGGAGAVGMAIRK